MEANKRALIELRKKTNYQGFNEAFKGPGDPSAIPNNNLSLTNGYILIGNSSNLAEEHQISGDATLSNTGVLTLNTVGISKGGTGKTSWTTGSIVFAGSTTLDEDNSYLYYDKTNHAVGLGTNSLYSNTMISGKAKDTTSTNYYLKYRNNGNTQDYFTISNRGAVTMYADTGTSTNKIIDAGSSTVSNALYLQENGYLLLKKKFGIRNNNTTLLAAITIGNTEDWLSNVGDEGIYMNEEDTLIPVIGMGYFGNSIGNEPTISFYKGRGSWSSKSNISSGDDIGSITWNIRDTTRKAVIKIGGTSKGTTAARFYIKNYFSGSNQEAFCVDEGNIGVHVSSPIAHFHSGKSSAFKTKTDSTSALALDKTSTIWIYTGSVATTWTLPLLSGNTDLFYIIKNRGSDNITLQREPVPGTDRIYYTSSVTSITIAPGEGYIISSDGSYFIAFKLP